VVADEPKSPVRHVEDAHPVVGEGNAVPVGHHRPGRAERAVLKPFGQRDPRDTVAQVGHGRERPIPSHSARGIHASSRRNLLQAAEARQHRGRARRHERFAQEFAPFDHTIANRHAILTVNESREDGRRS
jgi:hypothetical protein